ncbi:hypothetical protein PTTG_30592, partial [Puccinia triticina 1-1 BBBD Race 1]
MKINHLPKMVEDWLTERVVAGLSWNAIYELSLCQDLFAMVEPGVVPEASYIKYDHVRYLIRTRMAVVAKRDADPFVSITLWASNLQQQGWSTLLASSRDSPDFIFAFQSPWQQQQLLDHGQVVGKGLPVCWASTASAAAEPVEQLLRWLRQTTGIVPCAIMSDCALAIKNGATAAYADLGAQAPKIYWCVFHVLKAFKSKAISYLQDNSEDVITKFCNVLYEQRVCPEILLARLYVKWSRINPAFVRYVQIQWHTNVTHWAMYFRS